MRVETRFDGVVDGGEEFFRLLFTGEPLDRDYVRHLVDDVMLRLAQVQCRG